MMQVIKRDGKYAPFNKEKIKSAVYKALSASGLPSESIADKVTGDVVEKLDKLEEGRCATVEDIQDLVEKSLMARGMHDAAKAYILYRDEHARRRKQLRVRKLRGSKQSVTDKSMLIQSMTTSTVSGWDRSKIWKQLKMQTLLSDDEAEEVAKEVEERVLATGLQTVNSEFVRELVNSVLTDKGYVEQLQSLTMYKVPKDYIDGLLETKVNENSNVVSNNPEAVSLAITDLVLKQYALDNVFSPDVKDAHNKATIYLHDLGYPTRVYCSSHSIEYIKKYGLKGLNNLNTISNPARSASVLTGHLNTFLASMQSNYAGALGLGYVNIFYAPLLVGMSYKEMKQVAQEMIFNGSQNAFSRGGQTLFLDYNIHTGVPSYLEKVPAIHAGGKYRMQRFEASESGQVGSVKGIASVEDDLIEGTLDDGSWCLKWHDPDENKDVVVLMEHDGKQEFVDQGYGHILTYGDYKKEAMAFAHALLDVWYEGDARGRVFEFPKCDFHVSAETFTDPEQYKVYEHACKLASHNGSTYFVFDRDSVSLASCCFTGDTEVLATYDKTKYPVRIKFSELEEDKPIWAFGPDSLSDVWRCTLKEYRLVKLKGKFDMIKLGFGDYSVTVTPDHGFVMVDGEDTKADDVIPGELLLIGNPDPSFKTQDGNTMFRMPDFFKNDRVLDMGDDYVVLQDVDRKAGQVNEVYCLEAVDQSCPYFLLPNGLVSHNCRLRVQITDMSLLTHPEHLRTCGFQNVTINVPQAAYRAALRDSKTLETTLEEIDNAMDLAVKAHLQKKEFIERMMKKGGPLWQLGKEACDGRPYLDLKDATYIIGIIGVNDAVQFLTGKQMHESEESMDMALRIAGHMYLRTKEYTKQYGLTFKLEESPAESAARKIAKSDLVYFRNEALGVYKGGDEDHAYYTNSIHLAADAPVDLLERIDAQAKFNSIIEAGAITHAFIGEEQPQPKAIAELIREAFLRTQSAQITFSPEFTYCETCGRNSRGLNEKCPVCGSTDVVGETRIVGYFSKLTGWNLSKLAEQRARQRGHYEVEGNKN